MDGELLGPYNGTFLVPSWASVIVACYLWLPHVVHAGCLFFWGRLCCVAVLFISCGVNPPS